MIFSGRHHNSDFFQSGGVSKTFIVLLTLIVLSTAGFAAYVVLKPSESAEELEAAMLADDLGFTRGEYSLQEMRRIDRESRWPRLRELLVSGIRNKNNSDVKYALEYGVGSEIVNWAPQAYSLAIAHENQDAFKMLLKAGAPCDINSEPGGRAYQSAIRATDKKYLVMLLGKSCNCVCSYNRFLVASFLSNSKFPERRTMFPPNCLRD